MKNFNRPLGAFEKLFWLLDQSRPMHFALVAEMEEDIIVEDWQTALDAVQKRHPLLSVSIEDNETGVTRFRYQEGKIPLRVILDSSSNDWCDELAIELSKTFDFTKAPLVRAVLIKQAFKSVFFLVSHHSIADGISQTYVFRDILYALNGETLTEMPFPPSPDDLAGLTANIPFDPEIPSTMQSLPIGYKYKPVSHDIPVVQRLRLSPNLTAQIIQRAREEGTSVQGVLSAAFITAGKHIYAGWKNKPVRLVVPASTRKAMNAAETSSLYVITRYISFEPDLLPFWDMARYTKESLKGLTDTEHILNDIAGSRQFVFNGLTVESAINTINTAMNHELFISNLGHLSFNSSFEKVKVTSLWGPTLSGYKDQQGIGITTTNDALCIIHTSHNPLKGLLEGTERVLMDECF